MEIKTTQQELQKRKLMVCTPMFGGMAHGNYCAGMVSLAILCCQYGIEFRPYYLFNESLITRARNYCVDEFLRSGYTHLLFIDSDIGFNAQDIIAMLALQSDESEYDILAAPYPKKSLPSFVKILTEDGVKHISELVNSKYSGKVLSLNHETNEMEWKKVVNHFKNPNQNKWIALSTDSNMHDLVVTYDHDCYVTDNVITPTVYKTEARNTLDKYMVVYPQDKGRTNKVNFLYNDEQMSFLIGTLFGDGSIDSKGYLKFGHCSDQQDYLKLKASIFGGEITPKKKTGEYKGKEYSGNFLYCPRNAQISKLRDLFYEGGKRTVKNLIHMIDEKALAFWYMDDGSYDADHMTVRMSTEGFSTEDNTLIKGWFSNRFNIDVSHHNRPNGSVMTYINKDNSEKLFTLIAKYVPVSMEHKLPEAYRGGEKHVFNIDCLSFGAVKVNEIKTKGSRLRNAGCQYDITVEDNHNFVADGYVVSNCISWEKIKVAVDKGMADEDAEVLAKYVGDYVFNPKNNTGSFAISEPVEVLEAGTGFMMIRRNTFEKFAKAFPQYSYIPDHARTEHFDGSREIIQYFQAEIDPKSKRYLSEDYWFNQKCWEIGLKTWLTPWISLNHTGSMTFAGSLGDIATLGVSPTVDPSMLAKNFKKNK